MKYVQIILGWPLKIDWLTISLKLQKTSLTLYIKCSNNNVKYILVSFTQAAFELKRLGFKIRVQIFGSHFIHIRMIHQQHMQCSCTTKNATANNVTNMCTWCGTKTDHFNFFCFLFVSNVTRRIITIAILLFIVC